MTSTNKKNFKSLLSSPESRDSLLSLLEENFPKGAEQTQALKFEKEFSALLNEDNLDRVLFVEEEGTLASTLTWKPYTLHDGTPAACIGLVVTHPEHRKKGLSRALILEAEKQAKAYGAAIICLWSDLVDFYFNLGYTLAGSELSWDLSQSPDIHKFEISSSTNFRDAVNEDISTLQKIYSEQKVGPHRKTVDFERQLSQTHATSLMAESPQNNLIAYAFTGKGRDLRNVIHEIAGDHELFTDLLKKTYNDVKSKDTSADVRLQFPFTHPKTTWLEHTLGAADQGAVCFAKVLDLGRIINSINNQLSLVGLKDLKVIMKTESLDIDKDIIPWALEKNGEAIFLSPDPAHLLQIFMSPWPLENLEGLNAETLQALENWAPFPLYFWGMDSV